MKKIYLWCAFSLVFAFANIAAAQETTDASLNMATLYSSIAHPKRASNNCYSFEKRDFDLCRNNNWDLIYGAMRVGDLWDWFQVSTGKGVRSKIVGLGKRDWTDSIKVPHIEPFPKLKDGEQRHIKIDASGANGKPGRRGADGAPGINGDGTVSAHPVILNPNSPDEPIGARNEPDLKATPKVDPVFVRAEVGKMYAMRVVDEDSDYYVLFRVESIEKGDKCIITWKRVASPEK